MNKVFIFTKSYPYDYASEINFLNQEIDEIRKYFDKVYVIPEITKGSKIFLDDDIEVVEAFSIYRNLFFNRLICFISCFNYFLLKEIINKSKIRKLSFFDIARIIKYNFNVEISRKWGKGFFKNHNNTNCTKNIVYSWWFDYTSLGLSFVRDNNIKFTLCSRAHGYDLYEDRNKLGFIPFRETALGLIDKVYTDSFAGESYISKKYPQFRNKISTSLLGVKKPKFNNVKKDDGIVRFVSCSFVIPLKRVEMIVKSIAILANERKDIFFEYTHFGDGPMLGKIIDLARNILPNNVSWSFPGYQDLNQVYSYYSHFNISAFINVSETEGTPVSIMEAISYSLPIIATAVGGNQEIVSSKNGLLVNKNFKLIDLKNCLDQLAFNFELRNKLSLGSYEVWNQYYNAEINYLSFSNEIKKI